MTSDRSMRDPGRGAASAFIAVLAAVVVALGAAGVVGLSSAAAAPKHQLFTLVAENAHGSGTPANFFSSLAQNAQGTFDVPISRDGSPAGTSQTIYTVTRADPTDPILMIECSIELPEGNLLFNGTFHPADLATGAIVPVVGGTGAYAAFTGTVTIFQTAAPATLVFDLEKP